MRAYCSVCEKTVDVVPTHSASYSSGVRCKVRFEELARKHTRYDSGVTREEADAMKDLIGACEICNRSLDNTKRLVIDHNHTTGQVRGVLCSRCNIALHSYEDPELSQNIQEYLDYWNSKADDPSQTLPDLY